MNLSAVNQAEHLNKLIVDGGTKHPDNNIDNLVSIAVSRPRIDDERLIFQHYRDRIIWSNSFRRLAYKTQIFPNEYGEDTRKRLTHSLEVAQLATNIAKACGYNPVLTEAIALAHDLGHTPFGHAGEESLDKALKLISESSSSPLFNKIARFNHYEQGLDVVNYIDSPRLLTKDRCGLRLGNEIQEGILKHTYNLSMQPSGDKKSLGFLLKNTKYPDLVNATNRLGTIEAQIVRVCDKMSYCISDIEDGLFVGAIHLQDLDFQILQKNIKAAKEKLSTKNINSFSDFDIFRTVRDEIKRDFVLDIIDPYEKRNTTSGTLIKNNEGVMKHLDRIWKNLQVKKLFKHYALDRTAKRSRHIVSCLFCHYVRHPELIPWTFRWRYHIDGSFHDRIQELYCFEKGQTIELKLDKWLNFRRDIEQTNCHKCQDFNPQNSIQLLFTDLICVKDYIAWMTDESAENTFKNQVTCHYSLEDYQKLGFNKIKKSVAFSISSN